MENLVDASLNDLTNMIHTYKRKLNGEVTRVKTVDTISKLRKRPDCVHSITTVTSELRNDFIENVWKPKKIMAESRANPDWDLSKITESCWG